MGSYVYRERAEPPVIGRAWPLVVGRRSHSWAGAGRATCGQGRARPLVGMRQPRPLGTPLRCRTTRGQAVGGCGGRLSAVFVFAQQS